MTDQSQPSVIAQAGRARAELKRADKLAGHPRYRPELRFEKYDDASSTIRDLLDILRLNRAQVAEVKAAVARHGERAEGRIGAWQPAPDPLAGRQPGRIVRLLRERVEGAVTDAVLSLYRRATSSWAGGNTTVRVAVAAEPCAYGRSSRAWSGNGKWRGLDADLFVTVSPSWRPRVAQVAGLADAGGMLTTHAEQIEDGAWAASWVEQARGFDLRVATGVILRADDGSFVHAKTLAAARRVAHQRTDMVATFRRSRRAVERAQVRHEQRRTLLGMDAADLIAEFGDVVVTLADSKRAGNCLSGTKSWTERHLPGRTEATVREILEIAPTDTYVLRAAAAAILRSGAAVAIAV